MTFNFIFVIILLEREVKEMNKREAFEIVYNELIKNPLLQGNYDAKNGNEHFMYGICTVMEVIANNVSEEKYDEYSTLWVNNMAKSEERE